MLGGSLFQRQAIPHFYCLGQPDFPATISIGLSFVSIYSHGLRADIFLRQMISGNKLRRLKPFSQQKCCWSVIIDVLVGEGALEI